MTFRGVLLGSIFAAFLACSSASAGYKAQYGNNTYDSERDTWVWNHYRTRTRRQDPMCHNIVDQWMAAQQREQQRARASQQSSPQLSYYPARYSEPQVQLVSAPAQEQQYRIEQRQETYTDYVTQCQFDRWGRKTGCIQVPVQRTRTINVKVPITQPTTKTTSSGAGKPKVVPHPSQPASEPWGPIPKEALPYLVGIMGMNKDSKFIDIGAGDGRVVRAMLESGVKDCTGIEIDPELANKAHRLVSHLGGTVYRGDALAEYSKALYKDRTHVFIHQHPDMAAEMVAMLPEGIRIVSFAHKIPGVYLDTHVCGDFTFYSGVTLGFFPSPDAPGPEEPPKPSDDDGLAAVLRAIEDLKATQKATSSPMPPISIQKPMPIARHKFEL